MISVNNYLNKSDSRAVSFLKGFVAPFAVRLQIGQPLSLQNGIYDDCVAIRSDWQQAGNHLKNAMEEYCGEKN